MESLAGEAHRAIGERVKAEGSPLISLIVEFVDDTGRAVYTARLGSSPAPAGGTPSMSGGAAPAQAQSASHAPAQAQSQTDGHRPIPGLSKPPAAQTKSHPLPGVSRIIAVGAGKGGVGKSTAALNIAVGLARRGHSVGLLDGDIYGPSMPTMLGLGGLDAVAREGMLEPFYTHGIKTMTIGKLVSPEQPLIWRGPMAHGAFKQLTEQTNWGTLDYLIIDLPPGTGDISLTMAQTLRLTGAVVVCTPQRVAQDDAVRAARMFQQLGVDVLGVIENMSYFVGDDGKVYDIFGRGGAEHMAQRLGLPFLGAIPITMSLRANSDTGDPTANFTGTDAAGVRLKQAIEEIVSMLEGQVSLALMRQGTSSPTLTIS
jgi:ATP-binding protein involved in chromosome partitioning